MDVLLTNDDGIRAGGLRALYAALLAAGHTVNVVAPITEQSAVGHAITFLNPIRADEIIEDGFSGIGCTGTPADCVKLGLSTLLKHQPDIVLSGINKGANVGVDIVYSGTVSAATEGALMGVHAMAVSVDDFMPGDLSEQAAYAVELMERIPWAELPDRTVMNCNFPRGPLAEAGPLVLCPHTRAAYEDWYLTREDPRGRPYYWLQGEIPEGRISPGKDRALLTEGHVTLTPLRIDFTCPEAMRTLERRGF